MSNPTEPGSAPTAPGLLGEKMIWDQLAELHHDLLGLVTVFSKVLEYLEAVLEKREARESEQRAALEGLLAAMRDLDASPDSTLDTALSKFRLGILRIVGEQ